MLKEERSVPHCIRSVLRVLLLRDDNTPFKLEVTDRYAVVSEQGLPLPSPGQFLDPVLCGSFPTVFDPFLQVLSTVEVLNHSADCLEDSSAQEAVAEFQVKLVARKVSTLIEFTTIDWCNSE